MNSSKVLILIFACFPFATVNANICSAEGVDPDNAILPHESDCRLFYKCANGKPWLMSCPKDLHFNLKTKECDWPESAGCRKAFESAKPCNPPDAPMCPPHVINRPSVYLPHESDCTKFYQCDWEVPHLHNCPDGLHFGMFNKVCDWPERAKCTCPNSTVAHP